MAKGQLELELRINSDPRVLATADARTELGHRADEVHWQGFGPEGKALRITQRLHETHGEVIVRFDGGAARAVLRAVRIGRDTPAPCAMPSAS